MKLVTAAGNIVTDSTELFKGRGYETASATVTGASKVGKWRELVDRVVNETVGKLVTPEDESATSYLPISQVVGVFPEAHSVGKMLAKLGQLLQEDEEDDYGILRPSAETFTKAWELVYVTGSRLLGDGLALPQGSVATDRRGGIRMRWVNDGKEVRLVVPADINDSPYIYSEEGDDFGTDLSVSPELLKRRLEWLIET